MFQGDMNGINYNSFYDFAEHRFTELGITPAQYDEIDEAIYGSDEFRMYAYKIKRCTRTRTHDWTECPYAHRGEKATRRDPREFAYLPIACPLFRNGQCTKEDACQYAHGVFEFWLHPERYRTRACTAGAFCQRKVCFFAHTSQQLRPEKKITCPFVYKPRTSGCGDGILGAAKSGGFEEEVSAPPIPRYWSPFRMEAGNGSYFGEVSELLTSFRETKITNFKQLEHAEENNTNAIYGAPDYDLPQIDWISELVG